MKTLKRRRRENKTDYLKRLKLLKSGSPRIVFRKTNKYLIVQYVTSEETKDKIEIGITSKKLINYGWPKNLEGSLKSLPASYLVGLLIGKKILKKLGWKIPQGEALIESNSNSCLFARAAESKTKKLLGFHPDASRLAREVTVGFITKEQAKKALSKVHNSKKSVKRVLKDAGVI